MSPPDHGGIRQTVRRVRATLRDHELLHPGERVLVAVSGGPDSLALLLILAVLRPKHGANLTAAYVDHGIRASSERTADRELVAATAARLDVPFVWTSADLRVATHGRSPEEAARLARYIALARLARQEGAATVAAGHTRSDQAETVLLRLLRGSGLHGLAAMTPSAPWPVPVPAYAPRLVRPLLRITRAETEAYCAYHEVTPRRDVENSNPRYTRNRVRHELLPTLRALNPRIEDALLNLADEAATITAALTAQQPAPPSPDARSEIALDIHDLLKLPQPVRIHRFRAALAALSGGHPPTRAALQRIEHLVATHTGHAAPLGGGIFAQREGDRIVLSPRRRPLPLPLPEDMPVAVPGVTTLGPWRVHTRVSDDPPGWDAARPHEVCLSSGAIRNLNLTAGRRRPGDRIALAGLNGTKKLQDLFVDAKHPRAERDQVPVFRTPDGIAWVAGFRPAGWALAGGPPSVVITMEPAAG